MLILWLVNEAVKNDKAKKGLSTKDSEVDVNPKIPDYLGDDPSLPPRTD